MTGTHPTHRGPSPAVVVAGHICLDIIPELPAGACGRAPTPGVLEPIGPVTLAVGGCVGNTGIALRRLGLAPTLVARIGDDLLGTLLRGLVRDAVPGDAARLLVTPGGRTSYSLVASRPGKDRAIQHFSGVNDTFVADDVAEELLVDGSLLHVGYPPLMAALVADRGRELWRLMDRARRRGLVTSLDMANPHRDAVPGGVPWPELLRRVLPAVDVFMPSLAEACRLLGRRVLRDEHGAPTLASVARLANEMVDLGAGVAGVKLGEHGLYVRTATAARLGAGAGLLSSAWADRELYSGVFASHVVGTVGAGDATIAGFLFGLLAGMSPDDTVTAACAVGGVSTEGADGTSSVPAWPEIEERLRRGWRRGAAAVPAGWTSARDGGPWRGPRDRGWPA